MRYFKIITHLILFALPALSSAAEKETAPQQVHPLNFDTAVNWITAIANNKTKPTLTPQELNTIGSALALLAKENTQKQELLPPTSKKKNADSWNRAALFAKTHQRDLVLGAAILIGKAAITPTDKSAAEMLKETPSKSGKTSHRRKKNLKSFLLETSQKILSANAHSQADAPIDTYWTELREVNRSRVDGAPLSDTTFIDSVRKTAALTAHQAVEKIREHPTSGTPAGENSGEEIDAKHDEIDALFSTDRSLLFEDPCPGPKRLK